MANSKSAAKQAIQSQARSQANKAKKSRARSGMRSVLKLIESGDAKAAGDKLKEVQALLDRLARKHLLTANAVARYKSRLNKRVKAIGTSS